MKKLVHLILIVLAFCALALCVHAEEVQAYSNGTDVYSDGTVEFYSNKDDEDKLYKLHLVSMAEEKILDKHIISMVNKDRYLYLLVYVDGRSSLLKFDTEDNSCSLEKEFDSLVTNIAIRDDFLYYTKGQSLYTYNVESKEDAPFIENGHTCFMLFTDHDTLKYYTLTDGASAYSENTYYFNGTAPTQADVSAPAANLMSISSYSPRLSEPSRTNPYYMHTSYGGLNECIHISGGSVLPNCVGYAWGRTYENLGSRPTLYKGNAESWYGYNDGYSRGSAPALGAVAVWAKGVIGNASDGAGHVAVVEVINGDTVTTSESGYNSFYFKTVTRSASNSNFSYPSTYRFLGFIYACGLNTSDPTPPAAPNIHVADYQRVDQPITIWWNAVDRASRYHYYIAEYPAAYAYTENARSGITYDTSISFSDLPAGEYTVFVQAETAFGVQGAQSNWCSFTIYQSDYIPVKTTTYNGHIYALYDDVLSWSSARQLCEDMGGHLVTITSRDENEFVQDLIEHGTREYYWLGAHNDNAADYENTSYAYNWVTGEAFSYSDWFDGEPSRTGSGAQIEHFVHMVKSYNSQWNDVHNTKRGNGFILEIEPDPQAIAATGTLNGHTYYVIDKNTTWTEAKAYCELLGGHLVTIDSQTEQSFVSSLLQQGSRGWYLLGGEKVDGRWTWLSGDPVEHIRWSSDEPNWNNHYLMMYRKEGTSVSFPNVYYPASDISRIGFICEVESTQASPHTVSTVKQSGGVCRVETQLENCPSSSNIFVAGYKDGQFVTVEIASCRGGSVICSLHEDIDEVKVLLLDGTSLAPLCGAETIPNSKWK